MDIKNNKMTSSRDSVNGCLVIFKKCNKYCCKFILIINKIPSDNIREVIYEDDFIRNVSYILYIHLNVLIYT